ncbi:MAG: HAD family hydrolase [Crocinitomicaceae bacterium]
MKTILFDLGGVLLNLDYQKTIDAFISLGIEDFKQLYAQAAQTALFDDFETGKISSEKFMNGIREISGISLSDNQIQSAWNAMLLDLPKHRVDLLKALSKHYQLLLFSNTNAIHLDAFRKIIEDQYGNRFLLEDLFEGTYYSHLEGVRKPNKEAFLHVLRKKGLQPEDVLFIDDSIQHVEGALAIGVNAHHLVKGEVRELLKSIGIHGID